MKKITIVNKTKHPPTENDYYIGRGSVLGNPYTSKALLKTKATYQCSSRDEAIDKYAEYLNQKIIDEDSEICDELNRIYTKALKNDINLVCYCVPKRCHGEVIKGIITGKLINFYLKK